MGKPPCKNRTQDLLVPKPYHTPKMPLGYKAMGFGVPIYPPISLSTHKKKVFFVFTCTPCSVEL
ncbi:hypothetical protein Hanom_Chr12g01130711 [Helianthus anomalus]